MIIKRAGSIIVITFEEDGSRWRFIGIVKKGNDWYMKLVPHEQTLRKEPDLSGKEYEVRLTEGGYGTLREVLG